MRSVIWRLQIGIRNPEKTTEKILLAVCFLAMGLTGVGLVLSYSRGSWLGVIVGLLYLLMIYGKCKWRWILLLFVVIGALIGIFWNETPDAAPWYVKRMDFARPSAQHRIAAWKAGFEIMWDHPFGVGWGRAEETYEKEYLPPEGGSAAITTNDYLIMGTELGLPGLVCFLTYVGLALNGKTTEQNAQDGKGKQQTFQRFGSQNSELGIKMACRAGALTLLVSFWFDCGLFKLATGTLFWILLELGVFDSNLTTG